jgi:hypothetical protein
MAYYRAGWRDAKAIFTSAFWTTANSNFLDIGVLEWCKLFADRNDPHFWRNIIGDAAAFEAGLLAELGITSEARAGYCQEMKTYRDKFIAHLDSEFTMHIPRLELAKESVFYYHAHIASTEQLDGVFVNLPRDLPAYYDKCASDALAVYE